MKMVCEAHLPLSPGNAISASTATSGVQPRVLGSRGMSDFRTLTITGVA
jgi:hypothetical protein